MEKLAGLLCFMFLFLVLMGCGSVESKPKVVEENGVGKEATVIMTSSQSLKINSIKATEKFDDHIYLNFKGYTNQLDDGSWIISLNNGERYSNNCYFIVKENQIIDFFGYHLEIVKLEPELNRITIKNRMIGE